MGWGECKREQRARAEEAAWIEVLEEKEACMLEELRSNRGKEEAGQMRPENRQRPDHAGCVDTVKDFILS